MDKNDDDEEINFEQPREFTSGSSRFDLKYDFSRYRAGKEYESKFQYTLGLNCFSSLEFRSINSCCLILN